MNVAFLNTHAALADWFQEDFPEVKRFLAVRKEIWDYSFLILLSYYKIQDTYFDLMDVWVPYLEKHRGNVRLLLLGWREFPATNYLQVGAFPPDLFSFLAEAKRIKEKPKYPKEKEGRPSLPYFTRILLSHQENALEQLLIELQRPLRAMEADFVNGSPRPEALETDSGKKTRQMFQKVAHVWKLQKQALALMPQYPQLSGLEKILDAWDGFLQKGAYPSLLLSVQIEDYLEYVIAEIVGFYKMDAIQPSKK